jgi:glutamine amidotransferase
MNIAIIDYGVGNLRSIQKSVELAGLKADITSDYRSASKASGMILPGVGAFGPAMEFMSRKRLDCLFNEFASAGKPVLGICLGMQLLFTASEEGGRNSGLGFFDGYVKMFPRKKNLKIPQMGWNSLRISSTSSRLFSGIRDGSYYYFVHSYVCIPDEKAVVSSITDYGIRFASAVERDSVYGLQFHPEKSGADGLRIIKNFCTIVRES